jgi:hypothetical protein
MTMTVRSMLQDGQPSRFHVRGAALAVMMCGLALDRGPMCV